MSSYEQNLERLLRLRKFHDQVKFVLEVAAESEASNWGSLEDPLRLRRIEVDELHLLPLLPALVQHLSSL